MSAEPIPTEEQLQWQLNELMRDPAYRDPSHPRHERVKSVVTKYFDQTYEGEVGTRRPNPIVIDTTPPNLK
jgi:hypothetical protein